MELRNPEDVQLPEPYNETDILTRLILFKCLRPDKLLIAIERLIVDRLGKIFTQQQQLKYTNAFEESSSRSPVIFLLSRNTDPLVEINNFLKLKNMSDK